MDGRDCDTNFPSISPVVRSLCDNCGDRGRCCRGINLNGDTPPNETKLECLVRLATVQHPDPHMLNLGLPFMPDYKDEEGKWRLSCPNLQEDGTCGDYENRPTLCRVFIPGYQHPCAMTTWW